MANIPTDPSDFHVLIVDDEANIRDVLYELISRQGYRVTTAPSGQEALQVLAQDRADLVITDLMMPRMSGWQLIKLIRQRYDYIPVVVLTGYISDEGEEMLTIGLQIMILNFIGLKSSVLGKNSTHFFRFNT